MRLAGFLPADDARRVEPPDRADRELVLVRDREGEDVRVAMRLRLRDRHISPPRNTPQA